MDIRSLDLNLLVVFDALLEHRGVTRAAEAIGLSQPAMSAALARLRRLFGDELFVRIGTEMRPTPLATQLGPAVRHVIHTVKTEILQTQGFDPATSRRTFNLITPDIGEINFLPRIVSALEQRAPGLDLKTRAMPRHEAGAALAAGEADLAVGYYPDLLKPGFFHQLLFRNRFVCILRKDHPKVGRRLTLEQYLGLAHAVVRPGREHLFEPFLEKQGYQRRVMLETSHFMTLLPIIEETDLIATVPKDLADTCVRHAAIRIVAVPLKAPTIEIHQFWHQRSHRDAANAWLRGLVHELFRA